MNSIINVTLFDQELEKLSSRKLKIGAKEAMQIAEQLYTKGFISYPRTETNIFPPGLDLANLVQQQTESNQWGGQQCINHDLLFYYFCLS